LIPSTPDFTACFNPDLTA